MAEGATPDTLSAEFITTLGDVAADEWNAVAETDYPFLRHDFLYGLEKTDCTTPETGWQPCHLLLRNGDTLIAVMPLYLKGHSYGEYVFDHSWANLHHQLGTPYYPKLQCAVPFTPAPGSRLLVAPGEDEESVRATMLRALPQIADALKVCPP